MGRLHITGLLLSASLLSGCIAELDPVDQASLEAGIPAFDFVWSGFNYGPVKVAMPDGELLIGEYRVIEPVGLPADAAPDGNVARQIVVRAADAQRQTRMVCDGYTVPGQHGAGMCKFGRLTYRFAF